MPPQSEYPSAWTAAEAILPHLEQHFASARLPENTAMASRPDADAVHSMINAGFWASLRREEGYTPKISLAYVSPEQAETRLMFERGIPLASQPLTKLAPAVERPGIHLGVWRTGEGLCVWGATRSLPPFCFVLETIAPGLLVVKHSRAEESGKFVNIAVIEGDRVKVIDERAAAVPDCPALLSTLLGPESQIFGPGPVNVLIQLAVSMRAHGRGGSLLVVPAGADAWKQSVLQPITYAIFPAFPGLAGVLDADPDERPHRRWKDALRRAVDGVAGLTAVDGATVIDDRHYVLAFGAKIIRRSGSPQVEKVIVTEPIEGAAAEIVEPAALGGTRHLSAAQFVNDQRDTLALVASQDGRFTVFGWSPCEEMVHAHRIEALLL